MSVEQYLLEELYACAMQDLNLYLTNNSKDQVLNSKIELKFLKFKNLIESLINLQN